MRAISSGRRRSTFCVAAILLACWQAFAVEDAYLVRDILPGNGNSNPTGLTVLGSFTYFSAASSGTNTELWRSDATNAGTVLVAEIRAGGTGSAPASFVTNGTFVFFTADNGSTGAEPFASNGNVGNATLLLDVRPGGTGSTVANATAAGTKVYFTANDNSTGVELYVTDGTSGGTLRPKDIRTGAGSSSTPLLLTAFGNSVIFEATDGSSGIEPYVSDGTNAGTFRLADIRSGANSSDPSSMKYVPALGLVFFDADAAGTTGRELHKTNGTSVGTVLVENLNSGGNNANPTNLTSALGKLFFSADGGGNGIEPYVSDGTVAGTFELSNISSGGGDSNPTGFTEVNGDVYFAADGSNGIELYMTDGTSVGTVLVENINSGGNDSSPSNLTKFGNLLFFTASDGSGQEPWISDGTTGGTFELADIRAGGTGSSVSNIIVTTDFVYFTADDNLTNGIEWWRTDGTTAGTILVHNINSGGNDSSPASPVLLGNTVLFSATNGGTNGRELFGIETIHPSVVSIVRASTDPTAAAQVNFTVTFSEGVTGVNAGDFTITAPGFSGTSIASVTPVSTTVYTVTVNTGTGAGTLRLDVDDNDSIVDLGLSANPIGGEGNNNGDFTTGEVYTVDRLTPSVSSIVRASSDPTNASSVNYTVTFSENVTGVNAADFTLTTTGLSGASVGTVTPVTASTYTVAVNTGTGTGTVRLDVTDNDSIIDSFSNPLGGTGAGNGNFTTGQVYTVDRTAPSVSSIVRADSNPTAAASVNFTVTFGETVTGVSTGDFTLNVSGVSGASVSSVTPVSGTVYTVAVNTGSGSGSIRLDLTDDDSIADSVGNVLGGAGTGNGNFTGGQSYTIDKSPPSVTSIVRVGASPTNAASVSYTVTFNENVTGVNNGDFTLTTTGVTGTSITSTTQVTASTYTVVVNTGSGSGTIRLDLTDNDSIQDTLLNRLGGTGNGNGNFTSGEVYTIDKTAPAVSSIVRAGADPTNASSVAFTVTFTENVSGVNGADFSLTTTGVSGTSVGTVTQVTPDVYTVNANTGSGSGTIRLNFVDNNSVTDSVGNTTAVGFTTGEVYTIDRTGPTVSSINRVDTDPTNASSVQYLVTYSENVTGVDTADFSLTVTGGITGQSIAGVTQTTASTYTVNVNTGTGDGTVRVNFIDNDTVADSLGNVAGGAGAGNANFTTGQTYTFDRTAPTVSSINRASSNPTAAASVNFTVTFSENVTGVNTADFTVDASGLTGASVTSVTPVSGTVYTVAVSTGSGSGTLGLDLTDDDSIADSVGNDLGGTGAGNGNFTTGQSYTVDRTSPSVSSIVRASANPTNAASVSYTVTFSENVTGVNNGDFTVTMSGVSGASVSSTTQVTASTYTVVVNTGSGSGTIRLDLADNDSIQDTLGNRLGGTGNGNGDFTSGELYAVDKVVPTCNTIVRADANPTNASSVNFTVTFSESVTGVNNGDFSLNTSGTIAGASVSSTTPFSGSTYTVTVNTGTGSGTIRLDFVDNNSVLDAAGNTTSSGFTGGPSYTIDRTNPSVSSINRADSDPTNAASVSYTVTFDENVSGVNAADFALTPTGTLSGHSITSVTPVSQNTYTVLVNTGTGSGTLRLDFVDDDSVVDGAGNKTGGTGAGNGNFITGQSYTIDRTAPTANITMPDSNPTRSNKVNFTVAFSESVGSSFNESDITVTGDQDIGSRTTVSVTGSGPTYNVEVKLIGGSLDGVIGISIGTDVFDLTGNQYGGGVSPGFYTVDNTPPTATITLLDPSPTNLNSVRFSVVFDETVGTTFGGADVTVTGSLASGATKNVSGSAANYTVTITPSNPNADGTISITLGVNIQDPADNDFLGLVSPVAYTIDNTGPTVASIVRTGSNPTNSASVQYTVTFSEAVTGVDTGDFTLTQTGLAGPSVTTVTPINATTYTVTANTGTGSGTLRLDVTDNDSIADLATNLLGGAGAGNGNFTTGQSYTVDKTAPTVQSIVASDPNPTNASTVNFLVTFSEDVSGVGSNLADFTLTTTGVTGASIASRTNLTGSTTQVTVNTGTGNGTIRLNVVDDDSITDTAGNKLGGTGTGNGDFTTGDVYTVDTVVPTVTSIVRSGTNPTGASSVQFTVTFNEDVTGVNVGDFNLTTTGVTGVSITSRTQLTPSTYQVTVNTGSGNGTIRLDLEDNDSILDTATNPLGGTGNGNGDFTTGEVYTIDKLLPSVTSIVRVDTNPTSASSVRFDVTFSENVSGVDTTDFALTTSGISGASVSGVSLSTATTYRVTVNTGSGDGTMRLDVTDDDSILDTGSNPLGGVGVGDGDFTTGEVYDVDKSMPLVASIVRASANPTNASSVDFTVTFSENVTGVNVGDFLLTTTGVTGASVTSRTQVTQSVYTIAVNTGSGSGTIRLDVSDNDSIKDLFNNPLGGSGVNNGDFTSGQVYNVDKTAPSVASVVRADHNPSSAASVNFTVNFSEVVTGVSQDDFALTTTGVSGASISSFTEDTPSQYTVGVNTGTGNGTIRLDVVDDDSVLDSISQPLGGAGAGNGNFTSGEAYTIDKESPNVVSIVRADANPTNAATLHFTVTFSEAVTDVGVEDFTATVTGSMAGTIVASVFQTSPTVFTVTVNSGTGAGTVRLDLVDDDTVVDLALNPLGGAGAGNGSFNTGQSYTVDVDPPVVSSVVRSGANPTNIFVVNFTVTFSENVTGVDVGDFVLTTTGLTGVSITARTKITPSVYTLVVNTGSGSGTIRLDVADNDSIVDGFNNPLGGSGIGNGNFTTGEVFTIDRTPPSVVSVTRAGLNPTADANVDFTVTFSENVTGVNAADFSLDTGGVSGASIQSVTPVSASVYTVNVTTGTGNGNIRLDVLDDDSIVDTLSNSLGGDGDENGEFTTGQAYNVNKSHPLVNAINRNSANPTGSALVTYRVHFTMNVTGVDTGDFALETTGITGASVDNLTQLQGNHYEAALNTGSGDGTLKLKLLDNDTIMDGSNRRLGGNGNGNGDYNLGETFTVDKSAPTVGISGPSSGSTYFGPVEYTVTYTGADTISLNESMVSLNTTGGATGTVSISGSGNTTRTVTISSITGVGTIGISIAAGSAEDSASNPAAAAGPSATFEVLDSASLPVNSWIVVAAVLLAAASWFAVRRKRAM